jgi:hypothetical protein
MQPIDEIIELGKRLADQGEYYAASVMMTLASSMCDGSLPELVEVVGAHNKKRLAINSAQLAKLLASESETDWPDSL